MLSLQAVVRGSAARRARVEENTASSAIGAWWRAARDARRLRVARRGVVALQSVVRGRRTRKEVQAICRELGRPLSKGRAATIIQVRCGVRGHPTKRWRQYEWCRGYWILEIACVYQPSY